MPFNVSGRLQGRLCQDCIESISAGTVLIYASNNSILAADTKEAIHILDEKAVAERASRLLGKAQLTDEGKFEIQIDEDNSQDYTGGPIEIHLLLSSVPGQQKELDKQLQVYLGTTQLRWDQTANGIFGHWDFTLSARIWCAIRALFDAWVICGQVISCEDQLPLANVRVVALDDDWLQDDTIGAAITDSNGHFRIDYSSIDFRQTFLSPYINLETPFPPFNTGPDVYFRVETNATEPFILLEEAPSRGRENDRKDIGHCFCVALCAELNPTQPDPQEEPALFTHVGNYSILTDFDGQGFTNDSQRNAFTATTVLRGLLPGGNSSNEMEYRFRIANLTSGTPLSDAEVVAAIEPTIIGSVTRRFPHDPLVVDSIPSVGYYRTFPYWLNKAGEAYNVDPDSAGWIKVPRLNNLDTVGQFQASYPSTQVFGLARINTKNLFDAGTFNLTVPTVHEAGNKMDASDRFAGPDQVFRIVFEAREVGTSSPTAVNTLDRMVVWNGNFYLTRHPSWNETTSTFGGVAMIDIQELMGAVTGCSEVNNTVTARYTGYHPYIDRTQMNITGPNGVFGQIAPITDADQEASGVHVYNFAAQPSCAFILKFWTYFRLTSGFGRRSDAYSRDEIAFCKG